MTDTSTVAPPLLSARKLFWLVFYAIILLAWLAVYRMSVALPQASLPGMSAEDFWNSLCLRAEQADPFSLFAMWALMTAAMMLPSVVPALRVFGELADVKASNRHSMASLAGGYAAVWLAFSAVAALLQASLSGFEVLAPDGASRSVWFASALLIAAGAYQFSPAKAACLAKCRHPLMVFMRHWRPGNAAAFAMGLRLGLDCVGCCWALMLLGFVGGAMNLLWMGAATLFMTFEKLPEAGRYLTKPAGLILLVAGAAVAAQATGIL